MTMDEELVVFLGGRACYHQAVQFLARGSYRVGWRNGCGSAIVCTGQRDFHRLPKAVAVSRWGKRPCKRCYPEVKQ